MNKSNILQSKFQDLSEYILFVPTSRAAEDWIDFVRISIELPIGLTKLTVDLQNITFLETDDIVMLSCVIEYLYFLNDKCEIDFKNGSINLNKHLHNINLKYFWSNQHDRNNFRNIGNSTTVSLWNIVNEHTFNYLNVMREFFLRKFINNKDLTDLTSNLDEVFNNIFDHSSSKINGFIISQYYPKNNILSCSICDLGIGIPKRINFDRLKNNETLFNDSNAIREALKRGVTTRTSPRNKGFGLNNILELTESSNGELRIISNNGYLSKSPGNDYINGDIKHYFPGTLIRIDVDVNTFETLSLVEDLFEF